MELSDKDLADVKRAKDLLESPGFGMNITNLLAIPVGRGFEVLPSGWKSRIQAASQRALATALHVALATVPDKQQRESSDYLHKMAVMMSGAAGGAFGLPSLAVELPLTTTVMLRSIADIARSEGEDLESPIGKLACLEVFALGGKSGADDAAEAGYFVVRAALARAVTDAFQYMAERGVVEEGAPVLVRLIGQIAARFGIVVSEKVAAEAVPIIGAVGGAMINTVFMDHFQNMAHGHFIIRRLERAYTPELVKETYASL
jgi:hypothetical protein